MREGGLGGGKCAGVMSKQPPPPSFLSVQAAVRAEADARADSLSAVSGFLASIAEKEEQLLSGARAPPNAGARRARAQPPSPSTAATAAPSALGVVDALHAEGNAAVAAGDYARAASLYSRVLAVQPGHFAALSNRALAHLKLKAYRSAIFDASGALRVDPLHTKSWMRRAAARVALGQHELAARDLEAAQALEPSNRAVLVEARKAAESVRAAQRRVAEVTLTVIDDDV